MRPLGAAGFSLSSLFLPFFSQKKTNVTGNRVSQVFRFLFAATSLPPQEQGKMLMWKRLSSLAFECAQT